MNQKSKKHYEQILIEDPGVQNPFYNSMPLKDYVNP